LIDPALKILLAVNALACLTLTVNAPEGCFASIDTVNGKVSYFDAQFGRNSCMFIPQ